MKTAIIFIALCAAFITASAQNSPETAQTQPRSPLIPHTIGLHLYSLHDERGNAAPGSLGWNDKTRGIYALWHLQDRPFGLPASGHLALGYIHRNSLYQPATYAAYHLRSQPLATPLGAFSAGASAGVFFTGYDRAVNPGVSHVGAVPAGHAVRVRCMAVCVNQLVKPQPAPLFAAGIFWQPSPQAPLTLGLQRLPRSGSIGSPAWALTLESTF